MLTESQSGLCIYHSKPAVSSFHLLSNWFLFLSLDKLTLLLGVTVEILSHGGSQRDMRTGILQKSLGEFP